ncbi:hypothetical protein AB0I84_27890 [Streptomyces spectabilis]
MTTTRASAVRWEHDLVQATGLGSASSVRYAIAIETGSARTAR